MSPPETSDTLREQLLEILESLQLDAAACDAKIAGGAETLLVVAHTQQSLYRLAIELARGYLDSLTDVPDLRQLQASIQVLLSALPKSRGRPRNPTSVGRMGLLNATPSNISSPVIADHKRSRGRPKKLTPKEEHDLITGLNSIRQRGDAGTDRDALAFLLKKAWPAALGDEKWHGRQIAQKVAGHAPVISRLRGKLGLQLKPRKLQKITK